MDIALGWHIIKAPGGDIIWHNGGTGGYRTLHGLQPAHARRRRRAVEHGHAGRRRTTSAAICSTPPLPLTQNFPPPPAIAHARSRSIRRCFDRYVGRYQLAPAAIITVTRDGGRFLAQLTGQPAFEIFAESEKKFFLKVVDAQLTFEIDAQNKASRSCCTRTASISARRGSKASRSRQR